MALKERAVLRPVFVLGLFVVAIGLAACAGGIPVQPGVPGTVAAAPSAAKPPVEQTVKLVLDKVVAGGGFYQVLAPTQNGSAGTLSVTFNKWKGATMTVRYGPLKPKGVPAIPSAKKTLLWLAMTVDKAVVTNGAWNVVLKNRTCKPGTDGGYFPSKGGWSTISTYACKDFVVLPQWTSLVPGTKYVAAMYY